MEKRQLGKSDLYVAPIIFGGNVFGFTIDEQQSFEILDAFIDAGFNSIDTADVYSRWKPGNKGGESETIIGKWMKAKGNRHEIVLATKVGSDMGHGHIDITEAYILKAVEASLERLQTDYIDLYFTHKDNTATPIEETLGAYDKLIQQGKVRWIGASNLSPERLQASLDASKKNNLPRYEVVQPEYNLYAREKFEETEARLYKKENLGVVTYFALAGGFLTGKYRSKNDLHKSMRGDGMKKYLNERGMCILNALDKISQQHHTTQATVALAWLINNPSVTAPIASVTKTEQLTSFTDAINLQLSKEDMAVLNEASAYNAIAKTT